MHAECEVLAAGRRGVAAPVIAKRANYFGRIIKAASVSPEGKAIPTPVRCDRQPGRKKCD